MRMIITLLTLGLPLCAAGTTPTPLITQPPIEVTSEDFEAFLLKVPAEYRPEVRASLERIGKSVDQVYANRILANEARKLGLDKDPLLKKRMVQIEEAYWATAWGEHYRRTMKVPDLTKRAEELYRVNKSRYVQPPRINASQLVISLQGRTRASALEYATALRTRAVSGEDFAALIVSFSEDPMASRTQGRLEGVSFKDLEAPLAAAAFALKAPGDVTAPIETKAGFHVLRLEARLPEKLIPFADVKDEIIESEANKYRDLEVDRQVDRLKNTPTTVVHTKNIEALRKELDQEEITRLHREQAKASERPAREGTR